MTNFEGKIDVKFKKVHEKAVIPAFSKPFDSGFDLRSIEDIYLVPGVIQAVRTGLCVQLPNPEITYPYVLEMQIRPRSGLSAKYGITIPNSPATIDNGYIGELIIPITMMKFNIYDDFDQIQYHSYEIKAGDKIAQAVIVPVLSSNILIFSEVDKLNETVRGKDGFGSTGK